MTQEVDADAAALLSSGALLIEGAGSSGSCWVNASIVDDGVVRRVRYVRGRWHCSGCRPTSPSARICVHVRAVMAVTSMDGEHAALEAMKQELATQLDRIERGTVVPPPGALHRPKGGRG